MIADWQTNRVYVSGLLRQKFPDTHRRISDALKSYSYTLEELPNTRDIWARDYMPIQVATNKFIEYRYDPDYLQGGPDDKQTREIKTYPDMVCDSIGLKTVKFDMIIDGGNLVKSENTLILTDKVIWENKRQYSERLLIRQLHETFEVEKVVLIPWDDECIYGHADGMLRFVNPETVLISGFYDTADQEFRTQILKSLEKAKLQWDWMRVSKNEVEDNIAYINFLQTNDFILVPALDRHEDDVAMEQISKYYPFYATQNRIHKIPMKEITRNDGALNCISWTTSE